MTLYFMISIHITVVMRAANMRLAEHVACKKFEEPMWYYSNGNGKEAKIWPI